jgi:hypothetical protein
MNATELKKDIKDIEGAIASPVTPDFIKEKMKSKLVELKQQLKELEYTKKLKNMDFKLVETTKSTEPTPAPDSKPKATDKPKSTPKKVDGKIALKEVIILWAEGDQSKYPTFPAKYKTWESANNGVKPMLEKEIGGYNKVKFEIHWEDGDTYEGRLDVSEREDNPYATSNVFGKHIYDYITYLINDGKLTDKEKQEYQDFLQKYDLGLISSVKSPAKKPTPAPTPEPAPKKKSVPVKKEDMPAEEEYDCDDLIAKAKERRKKARERAKLPKKQEVTKNIEKIDKVTDNIEKRAEKDNVSVSELEKLIEETEQLLNVLKARLKKLK